MATCLPACLHHSLAPCPAVLSCSLKLYNNLVEKCFKECVLDFRSKNLAKDEEKVRGPGWLLMLLNNKAALRHLTQRTCARTVGMACVRCTSQALELQHTGFGAVQAKHGWQLQPCLRVPVTRWRARLAACWQHLPQHGIASATPASKQP